MHVPPSDLVAQSQLVVTCREELIEGLTSTVERVAVARCEVVFRRHFDRDAAWQRLADLPMPGPGVHGVGGERAALRRHLDAVVQTGGQCTGNTHAHGGLREIADGAE